MSESVFAPSGLTAVPQAVPSPRLFRWQSALLLGIIVLLALVLRWPATQRGFLHWDEAQYLFSVQPAVLTLRQAVGLQDWPRLFPESAPFDREKAPYLAFTAKPGYELIVTLYGTAAGLTPQSVAVLSLLFGIGTIVVLYRLAGSLFDGWGAFTAALILAVSKYHVHYSGSQTSTVISVFFLLLAITLYLNTFGRLGLGGLALAGACLAYSAGTHFNVMLYVFVVFAFHLVRLLFDRNAGGALGLVVMGGAFLAVIGLFELFYRVLLPLAYDHLTVERVGFFAELRYRLGVLKWTLASGLDRFPRLLLDSEGWLVCGLALIGSILCVPRGLRDGRYAFLLLLTAAHVGSATLGGAFKSTIFPRMIVAILPLIAIWAATGLTQLIAILQRRICIRATGPILAAGLIIVSLVGVPRAWVVTTLKSGHVWEARYVIKRGGGQEVGLVMPIEQYYLGSFGGTYGLPTSLEDLRVLKQKTGVRLLALDYRVNVLEEWGNPLGPTLRAFERQVQPEATIPHPAGTALVLVGEDSMTREALERVLSDPRSNQIRLYDLSQLLDVQSNGGLPSR